MADLLRSGLGLIIADHSKIGREKKRKKEKVIKGKWHIGYKSTP
jgi:hypothetical protein